MASATYLLRRQNRHRWASYAVLAACMLLAKGSQAMATEQQGADSDVRASTQSSTRGDGEIIVTAQRREQNIQDVPLSVLAFQKDALEIAAVTSSEDLPRLATGVVVGYVGNAARIRIRGVGNSNFTPGDESSVAIYIDGVYMPVFEAGLLNLRNIERIEVSKGPQGTLFGRNAVGGVINVITKTPSYEPRLEISAGYGNYDSTEATLYATTGLGRHAAIDLAASYSDSWGGYGTNIATGNDTFVGRDLAIRSKLLVEPTDSLSITLSGDWSRGKNDRGNVRRRSPDYEAFDFSAYPGFYNTNSDFDDRSTKFQRGGSLTIQYGWNWARLLSISSIRKFGSDEGVDRDWTPTAIGSVLARIRNKSRTQEFQLTSSPESAVSWVGGLFYIETEGGYLPSSVFGTAPTAVVTSYLLKTKSISGYGEVTAPVFPNTNLTGGIRYTTDKRSVEGSTELQLRATGATVSVLAPFARQEARFGNWTYKISLDHHFNDDFMVYATHSTGFKSGAFPATSATAAPVRPEKMQAFEAGFKSELASGLTLNMAAFHYKIKNLQVLVVPPGQVLSVIANAARAKVDGIEGDFSWSPVRNFNVRGGLTWLNARYTDYPNAITRIPRQPGSLDANGRAPWVFVPGVNAAGQPLQDAPKWTANLSASYTIETSKGNWQPYLAVSYISDIMGSGGYPEFVTTDGYALLDGSLRWESTDRRLWAQLWMKNILNKKYEATAFTAETTGRGVRVGPPRTFGIKIGVNFGE